MKKMITRWIDWFEDHMNFVIELLALLGGLFSILFSLFVFIAMIFFPDIGFLKLEYVLLPGFIGFMGVAILIALRLVRHFTRDHSK